MRTRTSWGARIVAALAVCCLGLTACGGGGGNEKAPDVKTWQDDIKGGPLEVGALPTKDTPGYTFLEDLATGRLTSVETQTARGEKTGEVSAVQGAESPPGLEGIDKVIKDADKLQPRDYGISTSKAKDIIYPEISRLLFGKQDADETLQRLDKALRRYHKN